jgi:hypothetical protein
MGDPLQKVKPGQRLRIPAAAYNAFIDTTNKLKSVEFNRGGGPTAAGRPGGLILVRNDSGADQDRFAVLGIDGVVFPADVNLPGFQNQPVLTAVEPVVPDHSDRFVILWEPVADGKLGYAYAQGTPAVQVDVVDVDHRYAQIIDGDSTMLQSCFSGGVPLLYVQNSLGTQWGLVNLFPVVPSCTRMRVKGIYNDYLTCRTWDGVNEGPDIDVAKPYELRHVLGNYTGLSSLTTVATQTVTAVGGAVTETWKVTPDYKIDAEIQVATSTGGTGVTVSSVDLPLIDLNTAGRAWGVSP